LINAWVSPAPPLGPGGVSIVYENYTYTFVITKPDGVNITKVVPKSEGPGTTWFVYTPDKIGTYKIQLSWAGDETHEACISPVSTFIVQEEPIPSYPEVPLPSGYWERPISAEFREWYQISGPWLGSGHIFGGGNASRTFYNPYSKAPNTAHILWKKDTCFGGLVGGEYLSKFASVPRCTIIVMFGRAYYSISGYLYCVDLRTGQELWKVPGSGTPFGMPMVLTPPDPTGRAPSWTLGGVWLLTSNSLVLYDAYTGAVKRTFTRALETQDIVLSPQDVNDFYLDLPEKIQYGLKLGMFDINTRIRRKIEATSSRKRQGFERTKIGNQKYVWRNSVCRSLTNPIEGFKGAEGRWRC